MRLDIRTSGGDGTSIECLLKAQAMAMAGVCSAHVIHAAEVLVLINPLRI